MPKAKTKSPSYHTHCSLANRISALTRFAKFSAKTALMAKLLQISMIWNMYSRLGKLKKKAQKDFEGQTKARGRKTQIFIIFWTL